MKLDLYIDFDGVILNTIDISYKRIKEKYGESATEEDAAHYYKNINWETFLKECSPINESITNIKKIIDSGLYNLTILTHVLSEHESEEKEKYLKKQIKDIRFIPVTKPNPKWESVNCAGAILVDDYSENLDLWKKHDGIPVKFSQKEKNYEYITIKSLDELINLYPKFVKLDKKIKTLHKNWQI